MALVFPAASRQTERESSAASTRSRRRTTRLLSRTLIYPPRAARPKFLVAPRIDWLFGFPAKNLPANGRSKMGVSGFVCGQTYG
jgi:hypothetical protein